MVVQGDIDSMKYAFGFSVAEGVSHFKAGKHTEAMQHLNKALQIDSENVEALVARGALYVAIFRLQNSKML